MADNWLTVIESKEIGPWNIKTHALSSDIYLNQAIYSTCPKSFICIYIAKVNLLV